MNINIYSDYEFLIDTKGQTFELDPTKHLYIENCPSELTLRAYPLNQTKLSIPFAFSLKLTGNDIKCEASNIKAYKLKNRCDVFISPFVLPSVMCIYSQTHTIKNVRYTVCAYEDRIKVSSSRGEYVFEVNLHEAQSEISGNYIYILTKYDKKTLVCFDTTSNTFSSVTADQIDLKEKDIVARQNIDDMTHHTKILTLKSDLSTTKSDMYIDETLSKKCKADELVPYNFFEALKVEDENGALNFLCDDLKEILKDQNLLEFFGNFEKINVTSLSPLVYTLYLSDSAKDYKISVKDGKITEIEDC